MLDTGAVLQDRYRIVSLLGKGGMGAVYRAWDLRLKVPVALKEMVPQPGLDAQTLAQLREQFEQEALTLARLNHPNLVRVTDFFDAGDNVYLVMDFVAGESLADYIAREGAQSEAQVLTWARQLLDALEYCHSQDVLHRDIKPQNIIINAQGQAVLVDFGLVKLWNPNDPRTQTVMRGLGTPEYAPPEQYDAGSGHTSPASDIYSLGATLYHSLTGQSPPTATMRVVNPGALVPIRQFVPSVSVNTEAVITKATALRPGARYQSAREMANALVGPQIAAAPSRVPTYTPTAVLPETQQPPSMPRVPSQPMPVVAPPQRKRKWLWWVAGVAVLVVCVGVVVLGGAALRTIGERRGTPIASDTSVPPTTHPTMTAVPQATATPNLSGTATAEVQATATAQTLVKGTATAQAYATATAAAGRMDVVDAATDWSLLLYDDFTDETNGWPTVEGYEGTLVTGSRVIADGAYKFETRAIGDFVWPATPDTEPASDLYITVRAVRTFGTTDGRYGIVFRRLDKDNYYMFRITDSGYYQFRIRYQGEWATIIDWTETDAIRSGRENVLTAIVEGQHFTFYINDQFVGETTDDRLTSGIYGVIVGLQKGATGTFEFRDFEVRVP